MLRDVGRLMPLCPWSLGAQWPPLRRPPLELKPGRLAEVLVASFELNRQDPS